jgi:gluconate 5-dehydrogenase
MSGLFSLKGRVALVTGASRGLGLAMARALVENGATVVVNGRDIGTLSAAAEGIGAEPLPFDVTDAATSRRSLENIVERHGRLDILINNAGIQHRRPLVEWEDEDFDRVIAVNLSACFRMMRDAVRLMLPNRFGRVINIGSVAPILARPTLHGYTAAKAGLHGLTRSAAAEIGRHGITVNAIAPGTIDYVELDAALADLDHGDDWQKRSVPRPQDAGDIAAFLCSEQARFVTGSIIQVVSSAEP